MHTQTNVSTTPRARSNGNGAKQLPATKPAPVIDIAPQATTLTAVTVAPPESSIALKTLLAEFGLAPDGKKARRALRKAAFAWHTHADRWSFTNEQAADVRRVLAKLASGERTAKRVVPAMQASDL